MNIKGFSLVECMVYCAIASFLSLIAGNFCNRIIMEKKRLSREYQKTIGQWVIQRTLQKDIKEANNNPAEWLVLPAEFICRVGATSIGWSLHHSKLYRIKGDYDFLTRRWHEKTKSLVAENVDFFEVKIIQNQEYVEKLGYSLSYAQNVIERCVVVGYGA